MTRAHAVNDCVGVLLDCRQLHACALQRLCKGHGPCCNVKEEEASRQHQGYVAYVMSQTLQLLLEAMVCQYC